ncbi:putative cell surface protein [Chondromyces apiculatus DSM 436]|uniref:Putative cell surface protein n=2 Tax=Chondromyces apiculatus TaxID=51 RepID=A0A017SWN6_9BACT|nr:putative cell surface protein [Chondromyces apiculatus DSM 436]
MLWALPAPASAQVEFLQRCSQDSLDAYQAEQRINWARRCALNLHTSGPQDFFATGEPYAGGSGGPTLFDYLDDRYASRSYTGSYERLINTRYRYNLFLSSGGPTTQSRDPLNSWKWTKSLNYKRPRPMYPTFGSTNNIATAVLLKPSTNPADCNLYDAQGSASDTFHVLGFCTASCYTPEQKVLFPEGYQSIVEAADARRPTMMTLTPDALLGDIQVMENDVHSYIAELRDGEHVIFEIRTASGGLLRLTDEHPVVLGGGQLAQARTLQVEQELIREDGSLDSIVSVDKTTHHGKVYNLQPQTTDRVSNLLIAQGYVVGSARFQNDDIGYINRIILAGAIPDEVIPR